MVISDVDQWSRQRLIADDAHDCSAGHLQYVGGVDISFVKGDDVNACAALVVLSLPDLKVGIYYAFTCLFGFNIAFDHLRSYRNGVCL